MYNCVYSIGSHCVTASVLKKYALRKFSGFFDYLFLYKSENFLGILNDNFSHVLDLKNHSPIEFSHPLYEKLKDVSIYSKYDSSSIVTFTHHNLLDEKTYQHYLRAKERFLKLSNFNTLFIYTSYHGHEELNKERREEIVNVLREKYQFRTFHLLFIEIEENACTKKQYQCISKNEQYSVYTLNIHPDSYTGAIFKNDFDNENYINIIYDNFELAHQLVDKDTIDIISI